jgi:hypothetical protein
MKLKMSFNPFLLIAFVLLSIALLGALPSSSSSSLREGMENTALVQIGTPGQKVAVDPTAHANSITNAELTESVHILNDRLTLLEKSVKESKDKIASGEAQANAAVGNLQATLPS